MTQKVYEFIRDYIREKRLSPTIREIGDGCYAAHSTIMRHIDKLEGMGWISREMNKPRTIKLADNAPDYRSDD